MTLTLPAQKRQSFPRGFQPQSWLKRALDILQRGGDDDASAAAASASGSRSPCNDFSGGGIPMLKLFTSAAVSLLALLTLSASAPASTIYTFDAANYNVN